MITKKRIAEMREMAENKGKNYPYLSYCTWEEHLWLLNAFETLARALESQDHEPNNTSKCVLCRALAKVYGDNK